MYARHYAGALLILQVKISQENGRSFLFGWAFSCVGFVEGGAEEAEETGGVAGIGELAMSDLFVGGIVRARGLTRQGLAPSCYCCVLMCKMCGSSAGYARRLRAPGPKLAYIQHYVLNLQHITEWIC